jgi:hypothetical protein
MNYKLLATLKQMSNELIVAAIDLFGDKMQNKVYLGFDYDDFKIQSGCRRLNSSVKKFIIGYFQNLGAIVEDCGYGLGLTFDAMNVRLNSTQCKHFLTQYPLNRINVNDEGK